jgi:carbonic anhydrase
MKLLYFFLLTALWLLSISTTCAQLTWAPFQGSMPAHAVIGGSENGAQLPVCRCDYGGGKHPGKVVSAKCNIGWGGKEQSLTSFEVLVNPENIKLDWVKVVGATLPAGAVQGGSENSTPLYIGRVNYIAGGQQGLHSGKVFKSGAGYICNFGYGGEEISVNSDFEVLVQVPNLVQNGTFNGNPSYNAWKIAVVEGRVVNQQTGGHPGGYAWLNHNGGSADPAISQEIKGLMVDSMYVISGFFKPGSHAGIHHAKPGTPCLAVDVDGIEQREYIAPADITNLQRWDDKRWRSFSLPFKATRTSHTIRFRAEINGSDCDVALDNIFVGKNSKEHWEYGEAEHWADLCHPFLECDGTAQSPVDIKGWVNDASLQWPEVHHNPIESALINNGHTIEFEVPEEYQEHNKLRLGDAEYELLQFHFHSHSEHNINGIYYPMEVHLVHKNKQTGGLAVLGVLFKAGNSHRALAQLIDAGLPEHKDSLSGKFLLNPADFLPSGGGYYTYHGSLTTPPCSEIVTWFVFDTPVEASQEQINRFAPLLHDDYRPLNDLNGRVIKHAVGRH